MGHLPVKIGIVGCFGRGLWLATQLARQEFQVSYLDVSDRIGNWTPEDIEGPFGVFVSERLGASKIERLNEEDSLIESSRGFTIWLPSGPLELKGPLTKYRLEQLGIREKNHNKIRSDFETLPKAFLERLKKSNYQQAWLSALALSWGSGFYRSAVEALDHRKHAPLFAEFAVRFPTRQGIRKSFEWMKRNGVEVVEKATIVDLSLRARNLVRGLEYRRDKAESSELLEFDQVVWCLTGEETGLMGNKIQETICRGEVLEPDWTWVRFRLKITASSQREQIPIHVLIMDDPDLPWCHSHFLILQRTGSAELFDVWMMIPNIQRFSRDYLNNQGQKMLDVIRARVPLSAVEISEYPSSYDSTYNVAGPARFPVYMKEGSVRKTQRSRLHWQNVLFHGPETVLSFLWEKRLHHEQEILEDLVSQRLAKEKKHKDLNAEVKKDREL